MVQGNRTKATKKETTQIRLGTNTFVALVNL